MKNRMMIQRWLGIGAIFCLATYMASGGVGEGVERPVRATVNGVPVYSFGSTYVYAEPIDINKNVKLQAGNENPLTKMRLLKSWEIKEGWTGGCPPRVPRTEWMDRWQAPLLPVNLIDKNDKTYWSSRGQSRPDVQEEWIRIDLGIETMVQSVVLVRRHQPGGGAAFQHPDPEQRTGLRNGNGIPRQLKIQVARDAWQWETVFESDDYLVTDDNQLRLEFQFEPRPVKQVWIRGNELPKVVLFGPQAYAFSLAGVEVIDEKGNNAALSSRGAGVTVSSTCPTYPDSRYIHDDLWATAWDLGFKWVRVSAWDSVLQWSYVEREKKGQYYIDPVADQAVTELWENGVNVIMTLAYSNWLYTEEGARPYGEGAQDFTDISELAPHPIEGERLEAWLDWVQFMVTYYQNRVKYFCIWNEPQSAGGNYGWGDPEAFSQFVRTTVDRIKRSYGEALIAWPTAHTYGPFLKGCLERGIAPLFQMTHADLSDPVGIKKRWHDAGFGGRFITYEFGVSSGYPSDPNEKTGSSIPAITELEKAKRFADAMTHEAHHEIICSLTEWYNTYNVPMAIGLFRNGFAQDPFTPTQPQLAYYVVRNMSTLLAETRPAGYDTSLTDPGIDKPLTLLTFKKAEKPYMALWFGNSYDPDFADVPVDLTLRGVAALSAVAYDSLNGLQQKLICESTAEGVQVKGILLKDYPVFIEFEVHKNN